MSFGDVTKFRAKSSEREEKAWVLGCVHCVSFALCAAKCTVVAAGIETNKFAIRSHNGAILCLFDRTEDRI